MKAMRRRQMDERTERGCVYAYNRPCYRVSCVVTSHSFDRIIEVMLEIHLIKIKQYTHTLIGNFFVLSSGKSTYCQPLRWREIERTGIRECESVIIEKCVDRVDWFCFSFSACHSYILDAPSKWGSHITEHSHSTQSWTMLLLFFFLHSNTRHKIWKKWSRT